MPLHASLAVNKTTAAFVGTLFDLKVYEKDYSIPFCSNKFIVVQKPGISTNNDKRRY